MAKPGKGSSERWFTGEAIPPQEEPPPHPGNGLDYKPSPRPQSIDAESLDKLEFKPVRWLVEGLVPEGLVLLAGKSKIGKSWLLLGLALAVAGGLPLFGEKPTHRCGVLYLALEDNNRRLQKRMRMILGDAPAPSNLHLVTEWPTLDQGGLDHLDSWLREHPMVQLVIIDTFGKVRGKPDMRLGIYQQDVQDMQQIKLFGDQRAVTIALAHHTRKMDASDVFDLISGSTGLVGTADTLMVLGRKRGETKATLAIDGRDIIDAGEFALDFEKDTGRWKWLGEAKAVSDDTSKAAIYRALDDAKEPLTGSDIHEITGIGKGYIRQALFRLKSALKVVKLARGLWGIYGRDYSKKPGG